MKRRLALVLDKCLALISSGEATLEECLAQYPDQRAELGPLLELAVALQRAPRPAASPDAYSQGSARMLAALAQRQERQFSRRAERTTTSFLRLSRRALVAMACLLFVVAAGVLVYAWPQTTVAHAATLAAASGSVEVLHPGDEDWEPAASGQVLESGVRLRTGLASSASLRFFEGSTTELQGETELVLVRLNAQRDGGCVKIVLGQTLGSTRNLVRPLPDPESCFQIETPAALLAVHGSEFIVIVQPQGTTSVAVVDGALDVTGGTTTTTVRAGQQITVGPQQTPLPAGPIAEPTTTPTDMPSEAEEPAAEAWSHTPDEPDDDHRDEPTEDRQPEPHETTEAHEPSSDGTEEPEPGHAVDDHEPSDEEKAPGDGQETREDDEYDGTPSADDDDHDEAGPASAPEHGDDGTVEPTSTPDREGSDEAEH